MNVRLRVLQVIRICFQHDSLLIQARELAREGTNQTHRPIEMRGDCFARLYGPIIFVFALVSTILSSMQVALPAEQLVAVQWVSADSAC